MDRRFSASYTKIFNILSERKQTCCPTEITLSVSGEALRDVLQHCTYLAHDHVWAHLIPHMVSSLLYNLLRLSQRHSYGMSKRAKCGTARSKKNL